jgi:hypothetical protein
MEGEHSMNFTNFWLEKFNGRDNAEGRGVDETILKQISIKSDGNEWIRLILLRTGNSGRLVTAAVNVQVP